MTKELERKIESFEENPDMTEEQAYIACMEILYDEDFNDWNCLERLGIFVFPRSEWEDRWGNIQVSFDVHSPLIAPYYKKYFTKKHQKLLLQACHAFIEDITADRSDMY